MSSVTLRPVTGFAPPQRGWTFRGLYRTWRTRRRARQVFVAILHMADLPPG